MANGNARMTNGRFAKGNPGGPGGDHRSIKRGLDFKDAVMNAVTPAEVRAVTRRLLDIALHGEPKYALVAIRELLNRLLGKPGPAPSFEDASGPPSQMLVTNAADALKYIAAQSDEDVMRGVKCLPSTNGK